MVIRQDVFRLLEECGIRHDDKVTIHTALRAVGPIEGGADGLIDAFCQYLSDGLFIVPTHTWANVNRENPFFDVNETVPCIGTMAKVAAFRKDGIRSLHPTHSVAVFGKGAAEYIRGEEKAQTPAPVGGALSRLYEENGKILLVGVGHERNTYIHAVDERMDMPNRLNPDTFIATIRDHEGKEIKSLPFHSHKAAVTPENTSEYYPNCKEAFEYHGAVSYHHLGNALVTCCDVRRLTDVVMMIYARSGRDVCLTHTPVPEEYYK